MANRESIGNTSVDSIFHKSPNSSSPLRKKKNLSQNLCSSDLVENNDEAERLARRQGINTSVGPTLNLIKNDKRRSLGLGFVAHMSQAQLADRISQCIKLSAENKINIKNAFSMEIIDFMTYMIKKQDESMTNLQVASTSLDVSTKIYGFRVDGIHTQILQMMGGLDKQEKRDEAMGIEADSQTETIQEDEDNMKKPAKKKKKRSRQIIFSTIENLRGSIETAVPSLMMIGDGHSQTTDTLCQVSLPNHANSGFYLQMYNDIIVDVVNQTELCSQNEEVVSTSRIENLSQLDMCPSLSDFEFQGWTHNIESEANNDVQPEEETENKFHFDLNASLPADDEPADDGYINYFEIDNEEDNMDKCVQAHTETERIVDLEKVVTTNQLPKASEYSFLLKSTNMHWAGPSHWKLGNFKRVLGNSRVIETCHQGPGRKKKEIEVRYDGETKESVVTRFKPSHAIKLQAKTTKTEWQESNLTLPRDVHYDIASANKLYLHVLINVNPGDRDILDTTHVSDVLQDYDYNNDNDTSNYCPDIANEGYGTGEENNDDNVVVGLEDDSESVERVILTGDNLIAVPKLTNKICIAYSLRAKRIDMQQLKKSIWKNLTSISEKENLNIQEAVAQETANKINEDKRFSDIYKKLPNTLSKANAEALSFPISFVSLLHLANEKTLNIKSLPDMSDIIVEAN